MGKVGLSLTLPVKSVYGRQQVTCAGLCCRTAPDTQGRKVHVQERSELCSEVIPTQKDRGCRGLTETWKEVIPVHKDRSHKSLAEKWKEEGIAYQDFY